MSLFCALTRPYLRAYAAHVGAGAGDLDAELLRRRSLLQPANRLYLALSAAAVQWLLPMLVLGRPRSFSGLAPEEREAYLSRLQQTRSSALRACFFGAKTLALFVVYGARERLSELGYRR